MEFSFVKSLIDVYFRQTTEPTYGLTSNSESRPVDAWSAHDQYVLALHSRYSG